MEPSSTATFGELQHLLRSTLREYVSVASAIKVVDTLALVYTLRVLTARLD